MSRCIKKSEYVDLRRQNKIVNIALYEYNKDGNYNLSQKVN